MDSTIYLGTGFFVSAIGVLLAVSGWQQRKEHQLVTETPTTDIQDINSEGLVELKGTISGPVDGREFVSPIGQTDGAVFTRWMVREWNEGGENNTWRVIGRGTDSVPFYLDDGTDQIQVAVGDEPSDVTWKGGEIHTEEEVPLDSDTPGHITRFIQEHDVEAPSRSITNIIDVGNTPGDRRYSEWTLGIGDEIYLLGHVHAAERATTPLHPEDAVVAPKDNNRFILSELSEEELDLRLGVSLPFSVLIMLIGAGLLIFGYLNM